MKRFSLRIDGELHEKLRKESFETERSINELITELIECKYKEEEEMTKMKKAREELLNEEMDFNELDNKMVELGYLSEADSGVWDNCLADGNIVYTEETDDLGNTEPTIQIFFEVVIEAGEDEIAEATYIKVTSVEKF